MHESLLFLPNSLQDLDGLKETHSFHRCPLIGLSPELAWTVPALTQRLIADGVMSVWASLRWSEVDGARRSCSLFGGDPARGCQV